MNGRGGRDEGAIAVIVALFAIVMFMFGALVVERGVAFEARRDAQTAADAAALAAAAVFTGTNDDARRIFAVGQAAKYASSIYPADQPVGAYWAGCQAPLPTGEAGWEFSEQTTCVAFRRVAGRISTVQVMVPGLDTPGVFGAIGGDVRALAQAEVPGEAVARPYDCALCVVGSFTASGGHDVTVDGRVSVGIMLDNTGLSTTAPPVGGPPVDIAPAPARPGVTDPKSDAMSACTPGVYAAGISGCVTFAAGQYVITGGVNTFQTSPTGSVFYFTGTARLELGPAVTVTGPTSGPYQGYAMIFDPTVLFTVSLSNGPDVIVDGVFYAPSLTVTRGASNRVLQVKGSMILGRVDLPSGGGSGDIDVDGNGASTGFPPVVLGELGLVK